MIRGPLLAALIAIALAQPARAQSSMTLTELRALFIDAWTTSAQIDTVGVRIVGVSTRGKAVATEFAKHNAEPCEYPQGHPELCANYDRERVDLNLAVAALQKEWNSHEAERRTMRAHFATLMTRIRDAAYPGTMASWKEAMVRCSNVNGVSDAATCLTRAANRRR